MNAVHFGKAYKINTSNLEIAHRKADELIAEQQHAGVHAEKREYQEFVSLFPKSEAEFELAHQDPDQFEPRVIVLTDEADQALSLFKKYETAERIFKELVQTEASANPTGKIASLSRLLELFITPQCQEIDTAHRTFKQQAPFILIEA